MTWCSYVLLLASVAAGQVSPPAESPAVVEGRVVLSETNQPARKAHVSLGSYSGPSSFEFVATTDDAGHFRFADVRSGTYVLLASKTGYLPGGFREAQQGDPQRLLKVDAGASVQDIVLRLFPAGRISGQVLDRDGDPAPGYDVLLLAKHAGRKNDEPRIADQTTTDHEGQYRFDGLMPGSYYVRAGPGDDAGPVGAIKQITVDSAGNPVNLHPYRTFFPSGLSLTAAQKLHLRGGQEQAGVDIHVQSGPLLSVTGKVSGETAGALSRCRVRAAADNEADLSGKDGRLAPDGSFAIQDLPPGKYVITLLEEGGSGVRKMGATELELADQNITGLVITRFEPARVRVRVVMEKENRPLTVGSVHLELIGGGSNSQASQDQFTPQNAIYVLDDVEPGRYSVSYTKLRHCFLKSVTSDGHEVSPDGIEIASGAHLDVILTYSTNVASVSGDLERPQNKPSEAPQVVLLGEDGSRENVATDQFLHFSVEDKRPGKYLAFAAEERDPDLWSNDGFLALMRSAGTALELHEGEHATLHLKLITKDVTDQVRRQAGL